MCLALPPTAGIRILKKQAYRRHARLVTREGGKLGLIQNEDIGLESYGWKVSVYSLVGLAT